MSTDNSTKIKTRHGLILQGLVAKALDMAGYQYKENFQYDPISEVPDFLIPNEINPQYSIEVHQTDARNSFQMKILRSFTAVSEVKIQYPRIISVNILFGQPYSDIPMSNIDALCSIFDINIIPQQINEFTLNVQLLENICLDHAKDLGIDTKSAIQKISSDNPLLLKNLSELIHHSIINGKPNEKLRDLAHLDKQRITRLESLNVDIRNINIKNAMLKILFFTDSEFDDLAKNITTGNFMQQTLDKILLTRSGTITETLGHRKTTINSDVLHVLLHPDLCKFRAIFMSNIKYNAEMFYFFQDIQNPDRISKMVDHFLSVSPDNNKLRSSIIDQLHGERSVEHTRTWIADIIPLAAGSSHNYFNNIMFRHPKYKNRLGNPYNNIVVNSARLPRSNEDLQIYADIIVELHNATIKTMPSKEHLEQKLVQLRIDSAIKLQKLNPLIEILRYYCLNNSLNLTQKTISSIIMDLSDSKDVGSFLIYEIEDPISNKKILANSVAVSDNNGDHKSKEWGARRRSSLYRILGHKISKSEYQDALFILDGNWKSKYIQRLYISGWNHICYVDDIDSKLKEIFLRNK